jgi:prevent-host-death family protein
MKIEEVVSAAEANRRFRQLLRSVREGRTYVITVQDRPVARIIPFTDDKIRSVARSILFARLRSQPALNVGRWTRDELYDNDPQKPG